MFAQPTNIGHYSRNVFAVVPEVGLSVGFEVTAWLRLSLGYNFLYWSDVVRPGEQIDRVIGVGTATGLALGSANCGPGNRTNRAGDK